jgi:hypothetical protein
MTDQNAGDILGVEKRTRGPERKGYAADTYKQNE